MFKVTAHRVLMLVYYGILVIAAVAIVRSLWNRNAEMVIGLVALFGVTINMIQIEIIKKGKS